MFSFPEIASIWEWKATSPMSALWCLHEFAPTRTMKSRSAWETRWALKWGNHLKYNDIWYKTVLTFCYFFVYFVSCRKRWTCMNSFTFDTCFTTMPTNTELQRQLKWCEFIYTIRSKYINMSDLSNIQLYNTVWCLNHTWSAPFWMYFYVMLQVCMFSLWLSPLLLGLLMHFWQLNIPLSWMARKSLKSLHLTLNYTWDSQVLF